MKAIEQQIHFLYLFTTSSGQQHTVLIETITKPQLLALLEVILNVLRGTFDITPHNKRLLGSDKKVIRQVVDQGVSKKKKLSLLIKHSETFKRIVQVALKQIVDDRHGSRVSAHTKRRI